MLPILTLLTEKKTLPYEIALAAFFRLIKKSCKPHTKLTFKTNLQKKKILLINFFLSQIKNEDLYYLILGKYLIG